MSNDPPLRWAGICAALGVVIYALMAFGVFFPQPAAPFGTDIYDAYFYRLLEGRFDLPLRLLRLEGHYASDGTGILYHGIGPLLTRALLYPFVTLHEFPTAAFSVWMWSAIGTTIYHVLAYQVISKYAGPISVMWSVFIAVAVWIPAPGFLLTSTLVLYHEPLSVAYAGTAGVIYFFMRVALFDMPMRRALVPIAVLAALVLHTRPHVAVGIYAGAVMMTALALRYEMRRAIIPALVGMLALGAVGLSFLELNKARFGSAVQTHGQIDENHPDQIVQYGPVFFGTNYAVDGRGVVFIEHGRFHPWRILPNALIYAFDMPMFDRQIETLHHNATREVSGVGYIEAPRFGMIYVWPIWLLAAIFSMMLARPRLNGVGIKAVPVLLAAGIGALFILSYPTVAFRYRFEVWPLVVTLALLGFPGIVNRYGTDLLRWPRLRLLSAVVLAASVAIAVFIASILAQSYHVIPGTKYKQWDAAFCQRVISHHDFSAAEVESICVPDTAVFNAWENRQ